MKRFLTLAFLLLALWSPVSAATLAELQDGFSERSKEMQAAKSERLEKLAESYVAALKREEAKAQRSGSLEEVLAIREEIKLMEAGGKDLPELPAAAGKTLGEMRATYGTAVKKVAMDHAVRLVEMAERMTKALKEMEIEMTRGGKIEEAKAVRGALDDLSNNERVNEARLLAMVATPAAAGDTTWRSLKDAKDKIIHRGTFPVGWLDSKLGAAADTLLPDMEKAAAGKPAYVTVPAATVEFRMARPFRQLRFRAHLAAAGGDVEFQVAVKGKVIERFTLKGKPNGKDVECNFEATQVVEISAADNGSPNSDWAMWIDPQVR
jgi:hypothetical protein